MKRGPGGGLWTSRQKPLPPADPAREQAERLVTSGITKLEKAYIVAFRKESAEPLWFGKILVWQKQSSQRETTSKVKPTEPDRAEKNGYSVSDVRERELCEGVMKQSKSGEVHGGRQDRQRT